MTRMAMETGSMIIALQRSIATSALRKCPVCRAQLGRYPDVGGAARAVSSGDRAIHERRAGAETLICAVAFAPTPEAISFVRDDPTRLWAAYGPLRMNRGGALHGHDRHRQCACA